MSGASGSSNDPRRVGSFDLDRVANGDAQATADALQFLRDALNAQARLKPSGQWYDVPFNAADYTAKDAVNVAAGTWTVIAANVVTFEWRRFPPDTIAVHFVIVNTSTSAGGAKLKLCLKIPAGFKVYPGMQYVGVALADNAAGAFVGAVALVNGAVGAGTIPDQIAIELLPIVTNWANGSAAATSVSGFIMFRVANPANN